MAERRGVSVVGSVHMDLIASAARLPRAGETLPGTRFSMQPGGKGGNQAAAAARAGAPTFMIARLGADLFGASLREALEVSGVTTDFIATDPDEPTGASTVITGAGGEYGSVIVPAAAGRLSRADIDMALPAFRASRVLLLQLEIPPATSGYAARLAGEAGCRVILNAAPGSNVGAMSAELWDATRLLVVNAHEAAALAGDPVSDIASAGRIAAALRARHRLDAVVVTLGGRGAVAATPEGVLRQAAPGVEVVDTVGAGDAFLGALAAELSRGGGLAAALPLACAAGALAVTRPGAHAALPTLEEIRALAAELKTGSSVGD